MGVFGDMGRLMKTGLEQTVNTDHVGNLRRSADLAEQWSGFDPNQPTGLHGAATANPFANMAAYQSMTPCSGTVLSLAPTGADVSGVPVYRVELEVTVDGYAPYTTSYQTIIAAAALHNWQPGAVFPFRVSPQDRNSLMLG